MSFCKFSKIAFFIALSFTQNNALGQEKSDKKNRPMSNNERELFEEKRSRCFNGLAAACIDAGEVELSKNRIEGARNFFSQGCKYGDQQSCMGIARIHEKKGHMGDAKLVYKQACESGIPFGCLQWSRMEYQAGNEKEGARILNHACVKRAYQEACRAEDEIRRRK